MSFEVRKTTSRAPDLRAELTRDHPIVEVPHSGPSDEVRAGDGDITGIRGWILVFGYIDPLPDPGQLLAGHLNLRYPLLGNVSHRVDGFDAGSGGALFLPWPYVGFTLEDLSGGSPPRHVPKAVVSFLPVLADDPAPPGLRSVAYGRQRTLVPASGIRVEVPSGATEYRVMPADPLPRKKRLTISEQTGNTTWARYTIDPYEPLASGAALGHCAWQQTPLREGAAIYLEHDADRDRYATLYWRFDLGVSR